MAKRGWAWQTTMAGAVTVATLSPTQGSSAGGHFNPDGQPHGPLTAAHHAGDLPAHRVCDKLLMARARAVRLANVCRPAVAPPSPGSTRGQAPAGAASAAVSAAAVSGSVTTKRLPMPSPALLADTVPPSSPIRKRTTGRPMPTPTPLKPIVRLS